MGEPRFASRSGKRKPGGGVFPSRFRNAAEHSVEFIWGNRFISECFANRLVFLLLDNDIANAVSSAACQKGKRVVFGELKLCRKRSSRHSFGKKAFEIR